jgi:hypothetical protein
LSRYDTGVVSGALVLMEKDIALSNFQKEVVVSVTGNGIGHP